MWPWIKSNILTPIANFFSGIGRSIRNFFVSEQPRAEHQPLLQRAGQRTSSSPLLQALGTLSPSAFSPFDTLPDEIIREIGLRLSLDQRMQNESPFVLTCSQFYNAFQPQRLLNQFLQYVVYGNQKKAEAILLTIKETDPKLLEQLLTRKSTVVDYSGRTIHGAALQIALGAEDVKYHDHEECMTEMLIRHLKELPKGDDIITQQIREQFPEGWEEAEKARQERDLAELKKVVAAIENAQDGDNCDAAIQAFRAYLDNENRGKGEIKKGKHFNAQLLVDAFNLYVEKYNQLGGNWGSPKNILFWSKIIGGIERYLPACLAQALCQGAHQIVGVQATLDRRLTFGFDPDVTFYPLDANPGFRLGEDYAGCTSGRVGQAVGGAAPQWQADSNEIFKLCQTKKINGGKIMRQLPNNQPTSCHVVM